MCLIFQNSWELLDVPIAYDDYVEVRNAGGLDKYYTVGECACCV